MIYVRTALPWIDPGQPPDGRNGGVYPEGARLVVDQSVYRACSEYFEREFAPAEFRGVRYLHAVDHHGNPLPVVKKDPTQKITMPDPDPVAAPRVVGEIVERKGCGCSGRKARAAR